MTNYNFWGIDEKEEQVDETWETLHKHFEKLAREDESGLEKVERVTSK